MNCEITNQLVEAIKKAFIEHKEGGGNMATFSRLAQTQRPTMQDVISGKRSVTAKWAHSTLIKLGHIVRPLIIEKL